MAPVLKDEQQPRFHKGKLPAILAAFLFPQVANHVCQILPGDHIQLSQLFQDSQACFIEFFAGPLLHLQLPKAVAKELLQNITGQFPGDFGEQRNEGNCLGR